MKLLKIMLVLITVSLSLPLVALAQTETPYDLVNSVNNLRSLHGLEPYQIDPWLMAYAQEHAEYLAARQEGSHMHSDGTLPQDIGLQENVASGDVGIVTVAVVVYEIWVDWGHRHILIGYSSGEIGAGIAISENDQVYYTVNVRPGEDSEVITAVPFIPLATNAPGEDGSIIHVVGYGQSLWGIAESYGVTVESVRQLNSLSANSTVIQVGQELLIRAADTVTPSQLSQTPLVVTQTIVQKSPTLTAEIYSTDTIIPSSSIPIESTITPIDGYSYKKNIAPFAIITIGIIGLLLVMIFGFWKSSSGK